MDGRETVAWCRGPQGKVTQLEPVSLAVYVTCNTLVRRQRVMADSAKRVQKHRDKMKAAGLKPVTIWVPDVNAPGYAEQLAREIEIINNSPDEKLLLEQLSNIEIEGWKEPRGTCSGCGAPPR